MADMSRAELKYLVERQREEIRTLNEVGKLLSATTNAADILRLVTSYLHQAFPVALCGIWLLQERTLRVIPFAPIAQMEVTRAIRQMREAASELLHRPLTEEDSVPVMEVLDGRASTGMSSTVALRAHLEAPLTVKDQPIGLLCLFSGQEHGFSNEDHHAIGIVAEQLGAALRNAFLVEELRRAGELKNELLSIVSHELNTPLTAVREGVNLILEGEMGQITPDQQRLLTVASENADRLEQLFHKVKMATELTTGQTTFTFATVDVQTVLSHVEQTHRPVASAKGIQLTLTPSAGPLTCSMDRAHLIAALDQLIDNALHATSSGGTVTLQGSATPIGVDIQVIDTGTGIAPEAVPTLFEQFTSVGGIHNRKMGGLGLGLFIANSFIRGHGGTLHVDSTPGKGTRMLVRLPTNTPSGSPSASTPRSGA